MASTSKYLKVSEFYEEVKRQYSETENLRHYMDKSLEVLTSQINNRLSSLESQKSVGNELEQKYHDLEKKYTEQQQAVKNLLFKYTAQEQELLMLQNKTATQDQEIMSLRNTATTQENKIAMLEKRTTEIGKQPSQLNQLKTIQPLRDVHALQQQVQSLTSDTHALSVNEQARRQDFLALYNKTIASEHMITDLIAKTEHKFKNMDNILNTSLEAVNRKTQQDLMKAETIQNSSLASLDQKIESENLFLNQTIQELVKSLNFSIRATQLDIKDISETVAITSCVSDYGTRSSGEIIKFADVRTQVGINNLSTFQTNGKFVCEKTGLYLVSVYIFSYTDGALYSIYKNGNIISRVYIADHSGNWDHTGTGVVSLDLQTGDTVWIQTAVTMYINYAQYSCLTIVKIK